MSRFLGAAAFVAATVLAACSDPNELPKASVENAVDTLTLWTLSEGPLTAPTAYSVNNGGAVKTWEVGASFEFAYDLDPAGGSIFLPLDVLGLANPNSVRPGLKRSALPWDEMRKAPLNGYVTRDTVPIAEGDRFFLRTGINICSLYGVPLYGKLEVIDLDSTASTATFRVMANQNCGYRSLNLGIPKS